MRYIEKHNEPSELTKWKKKKATTYEELTHEIKEVIKEELRQEQHNICCYCESELEDDNMHIEHLLPQCKHKKASLDYSNMLCSCIDNPTKNTTLHCGHKKGSQEIPVTPLQSDCQEQFTFTVYGEIKGKTQAAQKTIEILDLNIQKLITNRKTTYDTFSQSVDDLSEEEFSTFVNECTTPDSKGNLSQFCSMIEYCFPIKAS